MVRPAESFPLKTVLFSAIMRQRKLPVSEFLNKLVSVADYRVIICYSVIKMGKKQNQIKLLPRLVLSVICLTMIASGLRVTFSGELTFKNYWGGVVFGPLAVILGVIFLYVVLFRWRTFDKPLVDKKGRKIEFPGDTFRKW